MQDEVRYWDSLIVGHCISHDLKNHFSERVSDFTFNKILQVSMDGPSVNLKFHIDVQSNHEELELPKLIDIAARRSDCTSITGSIVFSLSFCRTRWVKDKKTAERLIIIWPSLVNIVHHEESLPKSKHISCKSYKFVCRNF